jgi:hypothetical protein
MAISCGLTVHRLAELIFPYLTTVEGLKLAALWATSKAWSPAPLILGHAPTAKL